MMQPCLSHSHIQPSETHPQELMKNSSDKEYSSESKRNELDISSNAKRKHEDDSQSNCKEPIKKMRCDNSETFDQSKLHDPFQNHSFDKTNEKSEAVNKIYDNFVKCLDRALPSQMEEFEHNPATYDQNELHDISINNSFDKTKEKSETVQLWIRLPAHQKWRALFIIMDGTLLIGCTTPLILLIGSFATEDANRSSLVIAGCLQPQVVCRSVPCQHPYYRVISEYSAEKAPQKNVVSIEKKLLGAVDTIRYPREENQIWSDQEDHEVRGSKDRVASTCRPHSDSFNDTSRRRRSNCSTNNFQTPCRSKS
ncbi:hypothetical protein TNCV_130301 [Trichonephila clavipes]|nr:hypothetical protein TNCV_130301 [Trichonephila clavipes]